MIARVFRRVAHLTTEAAGSVWAVGLAFAFVVGWFVGGLVRFGFGDHYQMVINTTTTIVTFLMAFLIQAATNRGDRATHAKLDELIRSHEKAKNELIDLEHADDEKIDQVKEELKQQREANDA